MKKTVMMDEKFKDVGYLYRVASVSIDRVMLEKHKVNVMETFPVVRNHDCGIDGLEELIKNKSYSCTISDETKVGTVTQKVVVSLIAEVSKRVDEIVVDFEMGEKTIKKIQWLE